MYVLTLIMFVTITLLIYVLARFSPMQWEEPSNCIREPTELTNQYNFLNSFWFILGAFMQQGSDVAPESLSVRYLRISMSIDQKFRVKILCWHVVLLRLDHDRLIHR